MKTLVVGLWAGPGTGKSTNAALLFGKLKAAGVECEYAHEFAKDLTWEERHVAIANQAYIAGKQQYHIERLLGKVEVVVTDSPLPFCIVYAKGDGQQGYTNALGDHILRTYRAWDTMDFFLERNDQAHPYVEAGRNQDLREAEVLDATIRSCMERWLQTYHVVEIEDAEKTANHLFTLVTDRLQYRAVDDAVQDQARRVEHGFVLPDEIKP